jgi:alpha-acetolactate decarboxylase
MALLSAYQGEIFTGNRSTAAAESIDSAGGAFPRQAGAMLAHRHGSEAFQPSTMGMLLDGVYDGDIANPELLQHGGFGLGMSWSSMQASW